MAKSEQNLVSIATANGEAQAAILKGKLRSVGIWCTTQRFGNMMVSDMTSAGGVGGYGYSYDILVRARDEKAARRALN